MKICIVIPAWNEEKRIGRTLEEYGKFFQEKKKKGKIKDFQLLVVINNTTDKTEEVVKKKMGKIKEIKYLNFKPGGKDFAVIKGFLHALKKNWDLIGFVDADLATPAKSYNDLIENIEDSDAIIASRWMKGSKISGERTVLRKLQSWWFNFFIRSVLRMNYQDTQCGAKLFRKKVVKTVTPELGITKWAFDIDLLYRIKKHKFKVKEIPTEWTDIDGSHVELITPVQMFASIIRLRLIDSPFNFVVRAYDILLPEKLKVHSLK